MQGNPCIYAGDCVRMRKEKSWRQGENMIRFHNKMELGVRVAALLVTAVALVKLADLFFNALLSCLLLVWKHTAEGIAVPVLGETNEMEMELLTWVSFGMAVMAVYEIGRAHV